MSGKIKALCFSLVKQRQHKQKEKQTTCLLACTHTSTYVLLNTYWSNYNWSLHVKKRKKTKRLYFNTELVQVFVLAYKVVFCNSAQSCKQTMASLKLVYWLKAFSVLHLFSFFFVCQETFQNFFHWCSWGKHAKRKQDWLSALRDSRCL